MRFLNIVLIIASIATAYASFIDTCQDCRIELGADWLYCGACEKADGTTRKSTISLDDCFTNDRGQLAQQDR